jgi:hypothetical protein
MKNTLIAALLLLSAAAPVRSAEPDEMTKKMMEYGTPGEEHARLKPLIGKWEAKTTMWMAPGAKAEESKGKSSFEWVLDGRFLKQEFKGDFNGQKFEGLGYLGYDKFTKEYISTWMDSMMTGMMKSNGQWDAKTGTIKEKGTFACAMTGEKNKWYRSEWKLPKDKENTSLFAMWSKDAKGKEFKSMEIVYTRK